MIFQILILDWVFQRERCLQIHENVYMVMTENVSNFIKRSMDIGEFLLASYALLPHLNHGCEVREQLVQCVKIQEGANLKLLGCPASLLL